MKTSPAGIALIQKFEGFSPTVYDDAAGKPTIGYGHLIKKGESFTTLTEMQALAILYKDVVSAETAVSLLVKIPLSQGQFDALVSFTYNLGMKALQSSTLLKRLNEGNYTAAADNFQRWTYAGKTQLAGLVQRRAAEWALFTGGKND